MTRIWVEWGMQAKEGAVIQFILTPCAPSAIVGVLDGRALDVNLVLLPC